MTSSKEDDAVDKVVTLLQQIKVGLTEIDDLETSEERAARLEAILHRVSDVLTLYGANVFTLAVHQVQIIKQLSDVEELVRMRSPNSMPALPYFRQKASRDDTSN